MKFTPDIGLGLKFDIIYIFRKIDISMATLNSKKKKQLNFTSTRIILDIFWH